MSTTAAPPSIHPSSVVGPSAAIEYLPNAAELLRISVDQYERMTELGILLDGDPVELLDGFLVRKMSKNAAHSTSSNLTRKALEARLPAGWHYRGQDPIRLDDGEPEPDGAVVAGDERTYAGRHPVPAEIALVIEVAESSLVRDREWKRRIYARNNISTYWIVNLVDRTLEVYTQPSGPNAAPDYGDVRVLRAGDSAELGLDAGFKATVPVADLFA